MRSPDQLLASVQARAVHDAFLEASAAQWHRRADQLEAARPRAGDFHGQATREDLRAAYDRLTAAAAACRARATLTDGWAERVLGEAAQVLLMEVLVLQKTA